MVWWFRRKDSEMSRRHGWTNIFAAVAWAAVVVGVVGCASTGDEAGDDAEDELSQAESAQSPEGEGDGDDVLHEETTDVADRPVRPQREELDELYEDVVEQFESSGHLEQWEEQSSEDDDEIRVETEAVADDEQPELLDVARALISRMEAFLLNDVPIDVVVQQEPFFGEIEAQQKAAEKGKIHPSDVPDADAQHQTDYVVTAAVWREAGDGDGEWVFSLRIEWMDVQQQEVVFEATSEVVRTPPATVDDAG